MKGLVLTFFEPLGKREPITENRSITHTADFCTGKALCAFSDEIRSSLGARETGQVIEHLSGKHWDQTEFRSSELT